MRGMDERYIGTVSCALCPRSDNVSTFVSLSTSQAPYSLYCLFLSHFFLTCVCVCE
jgi:hypothetical protein